jgi:hypothetical protein
MRAACVPRCAPRLASGTIPRLGDPIRTTSRKSYRRPGGMWADPAALRRTALCPRSSPARSWRIVAHLPENGADDARPSKKPLPLELVTQRGSQLRDLRRPRSVGQLSPLEAQASRSTSRPSRTRTHAIWHGVPRADAVLKSTATHSPPRDSVSSALRDDELGATAGESCSPGATGSLARLKRARRLPRAMQPMVRTAGRRFQNGRSARRAPKRVGPAQEPRSTPRRRGCSRG